MTNINFVSMPFEVHIDNFNSCTLFQMLSFWPTLVQSVLFELWPQMDFNMAHLVCGRRLENLKTQCGDGEVLLISQNW